MDRLDHSETQISVRTPDAPDDDISPYLPLAEGQMRLLRLMPGHGDMPLVARLDVVDVPGGWETGSSSGSSQEAGSSDEEESDRDWHVEEECQEGYEAISYAWGDPTSCHQIRVLGARELGLTQSLFEALMQFRKSGDIRSLWADAVCINQEDDAEKSAQVNMMYTIFQAASKVLIWLGPSEDDVCPLFEAAHAVEEIKNRGSYTPAAQLIKKVSTGISRTQLCRDCGHDCMPRSDQLDCLLDALQKLQLRPWFSRLWTVQEVSGRAKTTLLCAGRHRAPFDGFGWFVAGLQSSEMLDIYNERQRIIVDRLGHHFFREAYYRVLLRDDYHTWSRLSDLFRFACTDPRDRVYATRSLLRLEHVEILKPDYSIETAACYRKFALAMMDGATFKGATYIPWMALALVGTVESDTTLHTGPSWVPKLNALTTASGVKIIRYMSQSRGSFTSVSKLFEWYIDPQHPSRLNVKGFLLARVCDIYPETAGLDMLSSGSDGFDVHQFLSSKGMMQAEALMLPKAAETNWDGRNQCENFFEAGKPYCREFEPGRVLGGIRGYADGVDIAWVPGTAQPGDWVCLFGGAPYPFVVRAVGDGTYKLFGNAYTAQTSLKGALQGSVGNCNVGANGGAYFRNACLNWEGVDLECPHLDELGEPEWRPSGSSQPDQDMLRMIDEMRWITLS